MPIIEDTNTSRLDGIIKLVSVGYDSTDITHDEVKHDNYLGYANRFVQRRVIGWADLTGDSRDDLEVAVSKVCAAEILKSAARVTQIDRSEAGARMENLSIKEAIGSFIADAIDIIEDIVPDLITGAVPYFHVIDISGDDYEDT